MVSFANLMKIFWHEKELFNNGTSVRTLKVWVVIHYFLTDIKETYKVVDAL